MRILDYDKDDGKYVITFEATHKELYHIISSIFSIKSSLISDYDKDIMQKLYDELLYVLSWFSQ